MNKAELITSMAEKSGLTKKDSEKALKSLIESVIETVSKDEEVKVVGFLTIGNRIVKEKKARNPKTQEEIIVPEHKKVYVKVGKEFKESIK